MDEKYIPLSAALKAFEDVEDLYSPEQGNTRYSPTDVEEILNGVEPANVRPVVRGEWNKSYADHEAFGVRPFFRYCSECHESTVYPYNFCPHCGADMRPEGGSDG